MEHYAIQLAGLIALGVGATWLSWRLRVPSILLLLIAGFLAGPVTGLLQPGTNQLEVKVTNLWHNRIVGDLRYPDAGEFAKTNMKHKFNAEMELLRSGLIGPVVLRQVQG